MCNCARSEHDTGADCGSLLPFLSRGAGARNDGIWIAAHARAASRIVNGVPVLVDDGEPVAAVPATHQSNPLGAEFEAILASGQDLVLHIGAGATGKKYGNCIELERKIFCHTDVVADAHAIPLRSQSVDRVMAFNVFEHLRYPQRAADEIFRVLKPGGSVMIHTAFLQALHEEPFHFYNATQYGVREWFARFEIERCHVSANFSPAYMLAFLSAQLLEAARIGSKASDELSRLGKTSLAEWAAFWGGAKPPPGLNRCRRCRKNSNNAWQPASS